MPRAAAVAALAALISAGVGIEPNAFSVVPDPKEIPTLIYESVGVVSAAGVGHLCGAAPAFASACGQQALCLLGQDGREGQEIGVDAHGHVVGGNWDNCARCSAVCRCVV